MGNHESILRKTTLSYLKTSWNVERILCFRCGQQLQVGDLVHHTSHGGSRIYHASCWASMVIDVSKEPIEAEKASVFSQFSEISGARLSSLSPGS